MVQKFFESSTTLFSNSSHTWWSQEGPYGILHRLNPLRLSYLKKQLLQKGAPIKGLEILDLGCGGGILCEPLARLGAKMTGIDSDDGSIKCARDHARQQHLDISYHIGKAEDHTKLFSSRFDCITAFELIEHVKDVTVFLTCCKLYLKPGGKLLISTMNRTWRSYWFGIFLAENILQWVPKGMHNWSLFLRPSEVISPLRSLGFEVDHIQGYSYDIMSDTWKFSKDLSINYILSAHLPL